MQKKGYEASKRKSQINRVILNLFESHLEHCSRVMELLSKRLKFCTDELTMMSKKQAHMQELGMESMVSDLTSGKRKLEDKYLEAELQIDVVLAGVIAIEEIIPDVFSELDDETAPNR